MDDNSYLDVDIIISDDVLVDPCLEDFIDQGQRTCDAIKATIGDHRAHAQAIRQMCLRSCDIFEHVNSSLVVRGKAVKTAIELFDRAVDLMDVPAGDTDSMQFRSNVKERALSLRKMLLTKNVTVLA